MFPEMSPVLYVQDAPGVSDVAEEQMSPWPKIAKVENKMKTNMNFRFKFDWTGRECSLLFIIEVFLK